MAALFRSPVSFIADENGTPVPAARIFFYEAGTTTPRNVYSDSALTVALTQPVVCDSAGRIPTIFMSPAAYKVRIEEATDPQDAAAGTGALIREVDDYDPGIGVGAGALPISAGGTGATSATVARTNLGAASTAEVNDLVAALNASILAAVPAGTVLPYAPAAAPVGWLLCYGQAVSRATYPTLFSAIGVGYGAGDGSTTFNLPDLRGRVIAGADNMGGAAAGRLTSASGMTTGDLAGAGGAQTHTLTTGEIPGHTHTGSTDTEPAHTHNYSETLTNQTTGEFLQGGTDWRVQTGNAATTGAGGEHSHDFTTASTGGGGAHTNVQPTLVLNFIIRAY